MLEALGKEEILNIELECLKDIHEFCIKNKIRYFLFYGTLLGAVRHKGFIPWGDDIDIAMPREDYVRFLKTYKSNKYKAYCCENNVDYPYAFAKVIDKSTVKIEPIKSKLKLGVDVDIFPLDFYDEKMLQTNVLKERNKLIKKLFCSLRMYYKKTV